MSTLRGYSKNWLLGQNAAWRTRCLQSAVGIAGLSAAILVFAALFLDSFSLFPGVYLYYGIICFLAAIAAAKGAGPIAVFALVASPVVVWFLFLVYSGASLHQMEPAGPLVQRFVGWMYHALLLSGVAFLLVYSVGRAYEWAVRDRSDRPGTVL